MKDDFVVGWKERGRSVDCGMKFGGRAGWNVELNLGGECETKLGLGVVRKVEPGLGVDCGIKFGLGVVWKIVPGLWVNWVVTL